MKKISFFGGFFLFIREKNYDFTSEKKNEKKKKNQIKKIIKLYEKEIIKYPPSHNMW